MSDNGRGRVYVQSAQWGFFFFIAYIGAAVYFVSISDGSFWGVVVAALMVGLVKGITIGLGYTQWSTAVIYLMMLLVLLFRPRGLFGERIQRFE